MAKEAAPRGRPPKVKAAMPATRTLTMTKDEAKHDSPRLAWYQQNGYTVTDKQWYWELTGSQADFEERERAYQARGIAQAEKVDKKKDGSDHDSQRERTISTIDRVPMSAADILGEDSADEIGEEGYVNP